MEKPAVAGQFMGIENERTVQGGLRTDARRKENRSMEINRGTKESFCVIGKEGSTNDEKGFIKKLWDEVNNNFDMVSDLVKRDEHDDIIGLWGVMSDFSRSMKPWEDDFSKGLYLAGVESWDDAMAPGGWTKWVVPTHDYLYVKVEERMPEAFYGVLDYIKNNGLELAGAVNEYYAPDENGQLYLFFPVRDIAV